MALEPEEDWVMVRDRPSERCSVAGKDAVERTVKSFDLLVVTKNTLAGVTVVPGRG